MEGNINFWEVKLVKGEEEKYDIDYLWVFIFFIVLGEKVFCFELDIVCGEVRGVFDINELFIFL